MTGPSNGRDWRPRWWVLGATTLALGLGLFGGFYDAITNAHDPTRFAFWVSLIGGAIAGFSLERWRG